MAGNKHTHHLGRKKAYFGEDGYGVAFKVFGATSGKSLYWDYTSDSLILKGFMVYGTSTTPLSTAVADIKFFSMYTKTTATSGDSRGIYWKHDLGGTIASTGYGDCARFFCNVSGTGYSYATGCHSTLEIAASATITGSGSGLRATLGAISQSRTLTGALSALHLCSDIGASNTLPTVHGFLRCTDDGSVRISNLAVIPNASNGTIFAAHTTQVLTHSIKIISENGTAYYIMCTDAATNRS